MPYNFMSDNASGVTDSIMQAMLAANAHDGSNPYGADELSAKLRKRFEEFFETKIDFYLTSTGTISNALALAAMTPSYGYIFCHELAHVQIDECGAPELFTGGAQLMLVPGKHGKMCCATLEEKIRQALSFRPHHNKPATITVTQSTECGTVYSLDELKELSAIAHKHNLKVHMDGARLANAIAALGCSPADVTWRCGVDILSFGATKNGALAAEAIIFFDQGLAHDFDYRHKRGGQLFSKARYFSAQFLAYMEDGLWLRNASTANALADRLVKGLLATDLAELLHPVMANEIFVKMPSVLADALRARGPKFYEWSAPAVPPRPAHPRPERV
eukprot:tig00021374_g21123.t1